MLILDSGTTSHLFHDKTIFHSYETNGACDVQTAGNGTLRTAALGCMSIQIDLTADETTTKTHLNFNDCLHAPYAPVNIISVSRLVEANFHVVFGKETTKIFFPPKQGKEPFTKYMIAYLIGRLFFIRADFIVPMSTDIPKPIEVNPERIILSYDHIPNTTDLWHRHLGYIGQDATRAMINQTYATGISKPSRVNNTHCISCIIGKFPARHYPSLQNRAEGILDLFHSDICGPFPTATPGGFRYFFILLDNCSNINATVVLKKESDVYKHFKSIQQKWELLTGWRIKHVRFDNACELVMGKLGAHMEECGITV